MPRNLSKSYLQRIGRMGGKATRKKRGRGFYSEISKKRKHFRGGRPKKIVPIEAVPEKKKKLSSKQVDKIVAALD